MLAVVAVVMYAQLRLHVVSPGAIDPILVIAPATCAIAMSALVARLLPFLARAANAGARRARGIVFPVAGWHVARGGATHGAFLLVLAAAVGTFGVTFLGTWSVSQEDQANAIVGADMVIAQTGSPGMAAELSSATGGTVTPVADEAVVLGSRADGVMLLAFDTGTAGPMIRGTLPGLTTWSSEMAGLAPETAGDPFAVDAGTFTVTVTGSGDLDLGDHSPGDLAVTPTFVLRDESGDVTTAIGDTVPLDGAPHDMEISRSGDQALDDGVVYVIAVDLQVSEQALGDLKPWDGARLSASASIDFRGAESSVGDWDAVSNATDRTVRAESVAAKDTTVQVSFSYAVVELSSQDAHLTLTSFPTSTEVPVVMSRELADDLGLVPGDRIAMMKDQTSVDAVLVRTVPYVPSHVRQDAMLADLNSLYRALLSTGDTTPLTNEWWVTSPHDTAADALRAQHIGPVTTSHETAAALRDGPVRVSLKFAWALAIGVAVLMAAIGAAALAAGEALQRTPAVARLRAIGVPRRAALASHLLQQAAVTLAAVALGMGVGAVLSQLIAPLLVVAPGGLRAVPPAAVVWSAGPVGLIVFAIAASGLIAGIPAALAMVRRSTVSALRAGDAT